MCNRGAIDCKTGKYSLAKYSIKGQEYKCPVCDNDLILKKGMINVDHFSHHSNSSCEFYNVSSSLTQYKRESYQHIQAKKTLKHILESGKDIFISRYCATGQCDYKITIKLDQIQDDNNTLFIEEYPFANIKYDVAKIENDCFVEGYEIYKTHYANEATRLNSTWYEFKSTSIIDIYADSSYEQSNKVHLTCIRSIIKCDDCILNEDINLKDTKLQEKIEMKLNDELKKNFNNNFIKSLYKQYLDKKMLSFKQIKCLFK